MARQESNHSDATLSLVARFGSKWLLGIPQSQKRYEGQALGDGGGNWTQATTNSLKALTVEEFQDCFQQWERPWVKRIELEGNYFEGDHIDFDNDV